MIRIMRWVVCSQRFQALQKSDSISISVDDRGDFRLVRYRCSFRDADTFASAIAPAVPAVQSFSRESTVDEWCEAEPLISEGVLAVIRTGGDTSSNTIEAHNEDKSEKMAQTILDALRAACQDMDKQTDEDALSRICSRIRHYASDQGASAHKCGEILSQHSDLQNLIWVSADMAHQVRIASKDPLHANDNFKAQWDRLFNAKHALVPDIQNSEVWKSRLIAAQKHFLSHSSPSRTSNNCVVEKVLKTFSFAKQRFDSTATPMMKYCCMLRPIALLCAMQAADDTWRCYLRIVEKFCCSLFLPCLPS